ncbi:hypothetical protein Dda_7807 [Drechslerella dactyloides]|uniref:Uncharacterized protein n=1 Tax=Drechslerella dactyloides TaxID=74499 RepID=A0AAD6IS43_DREDA|nr:hypothetical protein Dda_7807 [Drechslerella dactyloides]
MDLSDGYAVSSQSQTFDRHPSMQTPAHGSAPLSFMPKILLLARSINIDAITQEQSAPTAFRVLELNGTEDHDQLIDLVGDRLGFHKPPGKVVRSIQVHDEFGVTQIILDSEEALAWTFGQLKKDRELRMTVYAVPNDTYDSGSQNGSAGRILIDEITKALFDSSATPVYSRHRRSNDSDDKEDGRYSRASNVYGMAVDYDQRSYTSYERGRERERSLTAERRGRDRHRSPSPGKCSSDIRRRSISPRYRVYPNSYRERGYDREVGRENNTYIPNSKENEGPGNGNSGFATLTEPRDSPISPAAPSLSYPSRAVTPGREQRQTVYDPTRIDINGDIEEGEIANTAASAPIPAHNEQLNIKSSSPVIETRRHSQLLHQSQYIPRQREPFPKRQYRRLPGFGRDNNIPGRERPSKPTGLRDEPWRNVRFCEMKVSPAGTGRWVPYEADHLRVRVCTSCGFQDTYDNVMNELFRKNYNSPSRGRNIPRDPGLVLMLYMRIKEPIYEADGDVGVLVNANSIVPGTLKWNWHDEALYLRFTTNGRAPAIQRETPPGFIQERGNPEKNGDCNVAINFRVCPVDRAKGDNWNAISAMWSRVQPIDQQFEFIIRVSRSQLTAEAWETISTYEKAEYAPLSEFEVKSTAAEL